MFAGLDFVKICKIIVLIAACIALVYVALNVFGVAVPYWLIQVFWIVVAAAIILFAIKIVAGMF